MSSDELDCAVLVESLEADLSSLAWLVFIFDLNWCHQLLSILSCRNGFEAKGICGVDIGQVVGWETYRMLFIDNPFRFLPLPKFCQFSSSPPSLPFFPLGRIDYSLARVLQGGVHKLHYACFPWYLFFLLQNWVVWWWFWLPFGNIASWISQVGLKLYFLSNLYHLLLLVE